MAIDGCVGILFDAENVITPKKEDLQKIENFVESSIGKIHSKIAIGCWNNATLRTMVPQIRANRWIMRTAEKQKNGADWVFACELLELSYDYPEIDTFVLITKDGDYKRAINTIRNRGQKIVLLTNNSLISASLKDVVDVIYYLKDIDENGKLNLNNSSFQTEAQSKIGEGDCVSVNSKTSSSKKIDSQNLKKDFKNGANKIQITEDTEKKIISTLGELSEKTKSEKTPFEIIVDEAYEDKFNTPPIISEKSNETNVVKKNGVLDGNKTHIDINSKKEFLKKIPLTPKNEKILEHSKNILNKIHVLTMKELLKSITQKDRNLSLSLFGPQIKSLLIQEDIATAYEDDAGELWICSTTHNIHIHNTITMLGDIISKNKKNIKLKQIQDEYLSHFTHKVKNMKQYVRYGVAQNIFKIVVENNEKYLTINRQQCNI